MIRNILLLCTLVFALPVNAQTVKLSQTLIERDQPFEITHPIDREVGALFASIDSNGQVQLKNLEDDHFRGPFSIEGDDKNVVTIMAAPPGRYIITTGESLLIEITERGSPPGPKPKPNPGPKPKPDPGPTPDPDPEPDPDQLLTKWVIWIREQGDEINHPEATKVSYSPEVFNLINDMNLSLYRYDDDQPNAKVFIKEANIPLPILVLGEQGENASNGVGKFKVFPAPTTVDQFETILRENTLR